MGSRSTSFDDIPLDIKKNIILGYITRPEDLKTLCLTSKQLRDIATPPLYRKVLLFIGGHKDIRVSGLLSPTNPGIQHIRKIYLQLEKTQVQTTQDIQTNSDDSSDDEGSVQIESTVGATRQAQFTIRLLLDFLPNDILENFSWQNWEPFSMDNWLLLMKKQKRLKAVEIESVDRDFMPELEKNPSLLTDLERVTSLHFYPDTIDRLKACGKVVETQTKFSELQLSSGFAYAPSIPDDLEDSSTRPGLLTRTIFSRMMPFETCTPLIIKKLSLDNINLRYAADTYMKFIKFSALESLLIGGCKGADSVFAQMSKPHVRPAKLKKIRWFHGEEATETHALGAFDGLLEAISGLEILHVDVKHLNGLPNPTAIANHGKTLQVLGIRSRTSSSYPRSYEGDQLDEICTACTELRQLSITFPSTSVSDAHPSYEFKQRLQCLKKLPYLMTLNLHHWPTTVSSFVSRNYKLKHEWYDLYEHALQRLAQQIFEASDANSKEQGFGLGHRSLLAVVAFGANGKSPTDTDANLQLKQLPFVRGLKTDPFGKKEMLAVKTSWQMVQFIEPESDILNHSIYDLHDIYNMP